MKQEFVELYNLGNGITVIRTDNNQLEATMVDGVHIRCEEIEPVSVDVLHAALDAINYLQQQLDKQKNFIYALDDLLEVVEINGLHDYHEYERAKKLVKDYNEGW